MQAETMVDLAHYPIARPESEQARAFALACHHEYEETGLCVLPSFILSAALDILVRETNELLDNAYYCESTHNAYLTESAQCVDQRDVKHRQEHTFVGSVPYDRIPQQSALNRLYMWDPLKTFIGAVLGRHPFYRFADPLGACSINVFSDGGNHGWHFDESEYTVTLMLQQPEHGGAFEYVPMIRDTTDEEAVVARVLDGDRNGVVKLPFNAGTLLIFGGKQTLHRVTQVRGSKPRLVPVLCYSETQNLVNSDAVRRLFWGRTGRETSL